MASSHALPAARLPVQPKPRARLEHAVALAATIALTNEAQSCLEATKRAPAKQSASGLPAKQTTSSSAPQHPGGHPLHWFWRTSSRPAHPDWHEYQHIFGHR
jgi:hypothetical protein